MTRTWRMLPPVSEPPYVLPPSEEQHLGQLAPPSWPAPSWWAATMQGSLAINNVLEYGNGVGTGDPTVDTPAIQAAIDDAISSGVAASVTREARAMVWLPRPPIGYYALNAGLTATSVHGLHILGAGAGITRLAPTAAMDSVFKGDGLTMSSIGGFSIHGDLQAGTKLDKCLDLVKTAASNNVTNMVTFHGIELFDAVFTTAGFRTTVTNNTNEVDLIKFYDCFARGGWTGSGSDSQNGFLFGSGTPANALGHFLYGCQVYRTRYALQTTGVSVGWWGGQGSQVLGDGFVYVSGAPKWIVLDGLRSEGSARFYEQLGWSTVTKVSARGCEYSADTINADSKWWKTIGAGDYDVDMIVTHSGAAVPVMSIEPANAGYFCYIGGRLAVDNTAPANQVVKAGAGTTVGLMAVLQQLDSSNAITAQSTAVAV